MKSVGEAMSDWAHVPAKALQKAVAFASRRARMDSIASYPRSQLPCPGGAQAASRPGHGSAGHGGPARAFRSPPTEAETRIAHSRSWWRSPPRTDFFTWPMRCAWGSTPRSRSSSPSPPSTRGFWPISASWCAPLEQMRRGEMGATQDALRTSVSGFSDRQACDASPGAGRRRRCGRQRHVTRGSEPVYKPGWTPARRSSSTPNALPLFDLRRPKAKRRASTDRQEDHGASWGAVRTASGRESSSTIAACTP